MQRRELLNLGIKAAAFAAAGPFAIAAAPAAEASPYAPLFPLLDRFVEQYLRQMNAPGLTLALADASGVQRVVAYGFGDLALRTPLDVERLFHIGSISKSFVGLCLLQLRDEGKLDLHAPIKRYLPWLRFDAATREITVHDLMTHAAALPDGPLFPADPALRLHATAAPGSFFHYCNMGYEALGHLIATLDGRPLPESFRARVLVPLGMNATEPTITLDIAARVAASYLVPLSDRPYPRHGVLAPALPMAFSSGAGCIASSARDMAAYLTMLLNSGRCATGHVASSAGFELFSHAHIEALEFGSGAAYGYGIVVDTLDGHRRLRHTGGMVSFASALEVDLDSGVGVFASINAMQGFRPRPVAEYALRLMRAVRDGAPLPPLPASESVLAVDAAADYGGRFVAADGRALEVVAEADRLSLMHRGARVPLEPTQGLADTFTVLHPDFERFALVFGRGSPGSKGPVVDAGWGPDWYTHARYRGPREFAVPAEWHGFSGHFRNEDPWIGSTRVVLRRGQLWLAGVIPLEAAAGGLFYLRDEPDNPEWVSFSDVVAGRAMRMRISGNDTVRV